MAAMKEQMQQVIEHIQLSVISGMPANCFIMLNTHFWANSNMSEVQVPQWFCMHVHYCRISAGVHSYLPCRQQRSLGKNAPQSVVYCHLLLLWQLEEFALVLLWSSCDS